jgi:hypothetical protein
LGPRPGANSITHAAHLLVVIHHRRLNEVRRFGVNAITPAAHLVDPPARCPLVSG